VPQTHRVKLHDVPDSQYSSVSASNSQYSASAAQQHCAPVPALDDAVTVETDVGPLYIRRDDTIIRPYLEEHGNWAPEQARLVRDVIGPGMRFVDVGAHVGYFSVLAGKLVGPAGVVFAFEPHPRNFDLLLANVWRNGLTNVLCFPWAVGESCGFAELFEASGNSGDHRLYHTEGEQRAAVSVRCVALDALVALRPPVDFIKVDVQGAEQAAMRGMEQLLATSPRATIALEYWPYGMARFGSDVPQVLPYYRQLGYVIRAHHPDGEGPVELDDDEILGLCKEWDGFGHADLVLQRESQPATHGLP
jgi:FkbM family methyltransferase